MVPLLQGRRVLRRGRRPGQGGDGPGPGAPAGPARRGPAAVRRRRHRERGQAKSPRLPRGGQGHRVRVPRPQHRQHDRRLEVGMFSP